VNAEAVTLLSAWVFDRDVDPHVAARAARDDREAPDLEVALASTRADVLVLHLLEGELPKAESVLFVEGRGVYEIVYTDERPALGAAGEPRVVLVVHARPCGCPPGAVREKS
jgi:hypothetical protein